jgi:hypothetical protein
MLAQMQRQVEILVPSMSSQRLPRVRNTSKQIHLNNVRLSGQREFYPLYMIS